MKKVTSISWIVKDIVLVGGYNVYPREVEEVLYTHESVAEVVVIGVPDENLGEAVSLRRSETNERNRRRTNALLYVTFSEI